MKGKRGVTAAEGGPGIGRGAYHRLPDWARDAVDRYLGERVGGGLFCEGYARQVRSRLSRFLEGCVAGGRASLGEIGVADVLAYMSAEHPECGDAEAGMRVDCARAFLGWAAERGLARTHVALACRKCYLDMADDLGPIDVGDAGPGIPADEFLGLARELAEVAMPAESYAAAGSSSALRVLTAVYISLCESGAGYTREFGSRWAGRTAERGAKAHRVQEHAARIASFERANAELLGPPARADGRRRVLPPEWARPAIDAWEALLARQGMAQSTACSARVAVARLAAHADLLGARSWADLSPDALEAFACAAGLGPSTAQLYCRKARAFLSWLAEEGEVAATLGLALPTPKAPPPAMPTVLGEQDLRAIARYRAEASGALAARDSAMVSLGLCMGLRASDVVGLGLSDIDWASSSVSLSQAKTRVPLVLPLPAAAGNDLARYILDYRPETGCGLVFVKHRAPYGGLRPDACRCALERAVGRGVGGFHILRRTFATGMLRGGTGRGLVAEALGHRGEGTVHRYLALDEDGMRLCALPLSSLPLSSLPGGAVTA